MFLYGFLCIRLFIPITYTCFLSKSIDFYSSPPLFLYSFYVYDSCQKQLNFTHPQTHTRILRLYFSLGLVLIAHKSEVNSTFLQYQYRSTKINGKKYCFLAIFYRVFDDKTRQFLTAQKPIF